MAEKQATLILKIKEMGSEALDRVGSGLKSIGTIALAAGTAILGFAALAVKNFREQEEATNRLTQAMVNNGVFSTELKEKYNALASAMQKVTTFGDEQVLSATAIIQQYSKGKEVTEGMIKATLDFATAQGMDLNSAAELVGKTIGSNTNALGRYGIEIDTAASSTEKTAQVVAKLNGLFGGQAEAAAQGLGSIEQLKNAFSDFMEVIGEGIAPTIGVIAKSFTDLFNTMSGGTGIADAFVKVFNYIAQGAMVVKFALNELGAAIGIGLAASIESVSAMTSLNFSKVKSITQAALDQMKESHTANAQQLNDELNAIENARVAQSEANRLKDESNLQASNERKRIVTAENDNLAAIEKETRIMEEEAYLAQLQNSNQEGQLQAQIAFLDKKIQNEQNTASKLALLRQKHDAADHLATLQHNKFIADQEKVKNDTLIANRRDTLSTITTLQSSSNSTLAAIGKAAGLTQIAIDTPIAISKALAAFPPPFNFAAAGVVGVAMAAQAAKLSGIPLAEGGIVKARPGGIQATIGEGGRDEAVIPLGDDEAQRRLGGGGVTIVVNGGLLGDPSSAREFAVAVDRELLKLRQNNESTAFDSGLI